jgi:tRNA A37 threonylcarbamoyladenosine dehydratase
VDFDDVCVTNINRQLHAMGGTVGQAKSDLMAERVKAINPAVEVEGIKAFYDGDTSEELLSPQPDYVVDCIDNVTAKMHLILTCIERGIPLVTCLGASAKVDPTRVRIATLGNTRMDRLARAVRKNLRRKHDIPEQRLDDVVAVYSEEDPVWPDTEYMSDLCGVDCVCPGKDNAKHTCRKRHVIHGSAVFVTSVFGMTAASVVVGDLTARFRHRMERNVIRERRLKKGE